MTSTKVKINELTSDTTLVSGDEFIFQETGGGTTKKINFNDLSAAVESNLSVTTSQLTADSDLDLGAFNLIATEATADEFIGDLRGAVIFKAQAGEALSVGEVVYISGISGNTTVVSKADADDAAKMPAFGIAASAASLNTPVDIYTFGTLGNLDTDTPGWSIGDELFVSTTAGALQNTPPTGESALIQKIAKVTRVHHSSGSIKITGAGRANATPNLNNGNIFIGNVSNQSVSSSLATEIESNITEASVTQHQAAIDHDALTNFVANEHIDWTSDQGATNIHLNNITGITTTEMASANISQWTNDAGYITDTLTTEEVQDIVGAMFSGNTETDITVTYQDSDGTIDVTLDALDTSNITSGTFADARIAESNVTQHEAALDHDALTNFVANEHINHTSVSITAGDGLSGGGDISSTRTIDLDIGGQTLVTANSGDMVIIEDASDANNIKKVDVGDFLSGAGDMLIATYDPTGVGGDAFAMSNMTGTAADATIAESNVTQHEAALSIAASQIAAGTFGSGDVTVDGALYVNGQIRHEGYPVNEISSDQTITVGSKYHVNTAAGAVTLTMYSANVGDRVYIMDIGGVADSNNIIFETASAVKIANSLEDFHIDLPYWGGWFIYTGSAKGWMLEG